MMGWCRDTSARDRAAYFLGPEGSFLSPNCVARFWLVMSTGHNKGRSAMRPSTSSFVVIRPRICAELCMRDAVAFSQYEQGGYLGSPILSSAVFSTRDHRGADLALPRPAVNSTVPLTRHGRTDVLVLSRVLRRVKACTEPRHYGRKAGHGGTRATDGRRGTGAPTLRAKKSRPRGARATVSTPRPRPLLLACSTSRLDQADSAPVASRVVLAVDAGDRDTGRLVLGMDDLPVADVDADVRDSS